LTRPRRSLIVNNSMALELVGGTTISLINASIGSPQRAPLGIPITSFDLPLITNGIFKVEYIESGFSIGLPPNVRLCSIRYLSELNASRYQCGCSSLRSIIRQPLMYLILRTPLYDKYHTITESNTKVIITAHKTIVRLFLLMVLGICGLCVLF